MRTWGLFEWGICALLLALALVLAIAIPASFEWGNECERRGGTQDSEMIGSINNVPIFESHCIGPDGSEIEW